MNEQEFTTTFRAVAARAVAQGWAEQLWFAALMNDALGSGSAYIWPAMFDDLLMPLIARAIVEQHGACNRYAVNDPFLNESRVVFCKRGWVPRINPELIQPRPGRAMAVIDLVPEPADWPQIVSPLGRPGVDFIAKTAPPAINAAEDVWFLSRNGPVKVPSKVENLGAALFVGEDARVFTRDEDSRMQQVLEQRRAVLAERDRIIAMLETAKVPTWQDVERSKEPAFKADIPESGGAFNVEAVRKFWAGTVELAPPPEEDSLRVLLEALRGEPGMVVKYSPPVMPTVNRPVSRKPEVPVQGGPRRYFDE